MAIDTTKKIKQVTYNGTEIPLSGYDTSDATVTADDMSYGVVAYGKDGKVYGTIPTIDSTSEQALGDSTVGFHGGLGKIQLAHRIPRLGMLFREGSTVILSASPSEFGDATAADVAKGKTFTSAAGLNVVGTAEAEFSIVVSVTSGSVVTATKGATVVRGTSVNGICTLTVPEAGTWSVKATLDGQTSYTKSVSVVDSYAVALFFVSSTLNNNEWSVIKSVSDAGQGANYWSIGDRKAVTLNGTVGKLSLSNVTTYAFIIGFNHNASVEGANRIHFQLAKTALSGGTDVCFCDNQYSPDSGWSSPGAGYFVMNASKNNSGGWKSSQMRTNICGTSLSSYSGTIIAVIPEALRAVLKSVTKYTDNTANGGGSTASYVTATTDYFFLLSEFEVFGSISYGNTNEKNKQAQYAYYSAGNSKIKYKHNGTSTAAIWLLRSPRASSSTTFVIVSADGTVGNSYANYSLGFAPGFCV